MKQVTTYGTFDLLHEGHYRLLERAKALGDFERLGITDVCILALQVFCMMLE